MSTTDFTYLNRIGIHNVRIAADTTARGLSTVHIVVNFYQERPVEDEDEWSMYRMTGKDVETMDDREFWDFLIKVVEKYGLVDISVNKSPEYEIILQILLGMPMEWGEVLEAVVERLEETSDFEVFYPYYGE